jgi:hypothetical protein
LKTLEDLARFKTVKEVLNSLTKDEIRPVLPVLTKIKDEALIVFPWDPEYEKFQKGELPGEIHARPSCPQDNTTRLVLRKGCWIPYCKTK